MNRPAIPVLKAAGLRIMRPDDVDAVFALLREAPTVPLWSRSTLAEGLSEASRLCLVAERQGELVGFLSVRLVAELCEVESIVVSERVRRSGQGRTLLQEALSWAQAQGATRVELEVRASNQAALALYESQGFQREGTRRGYYQQPQEHAILLGRNLS